MDDKIQSNDVLVWLSNEELINKRIDI